MSYATPDQFTAATGHLSLDVPEDLTGLLERASRDIDAFLAWPAAVAAGLRIDVTALTPFQADVLAQACARQAAYRCEIGEDDLVEGAPRLTAAPGGLAFATTAPDRIGVDVLVLLQGAGLLRRSGCAPPPPPDPVPLDPWLW